MAKININILISKEIKKRWQEAFTSPQFYFKPEIAFSCSEGQALKETDTSRSIHK